MDTQVYCEGLFYKTLKRALFFFKVNIQFFRKDPETKLQLEQTGSAGLGQRKSVSF